MRTVLLLVSCFFLSSTVQASLEPASNAMSCLYDTVSCSNVIPLRRETVQENAALPLPLTAILELSDFKTYPVQPTVEFTQPNGESLTDLTESPRTLLAGTITILNPSSAWTTASAGANISLGNIQLSAAIRIPAERVLPAGATISLDNGSLSSLKIASATLNTLIASSGALTVPVPASVNILLIGLAFMLFSSRRSTAHKAASC